MTTPPPSSDVGRVAAPAPRWAPAITFPLALLGLGIAIYLTIEHFTGTKNLFCSKTIFNCQLVTTSWESYFLGIPVAVLGMAQFVVLVGLCSPWAWRSELRLVHLARLAVTTVGMGFVVWLLFAEVVKIRAFCEWCSGVHLITFLLFVSTARTVPAMLGWAEPPATRATLAQ